MPCGVMPLSGSGITLSGNSFRAAISLPPSRTQLGVLTIQKRRGRRKWDTDLLLVTPPAIGQRSRRLAADDAYRGVRLFGPTRHGIAASRGGTHPRSRARILRRTPA